LFDGAIDKFEISPFLYSYSPSAATSKYRTLINNFNNKKHAATNSDDKKDENFLKPSPYANNDVPMHIQKSFVLNRVVTSLQCTVSKHGIANKNILIGF
jgi:hypothetical protein